MKEKKKARQVEFHFLTIFPRIFDSYLNESLFRRARMEGTVKVFVHNIRDFSRERHKKVDDRPFGGGPGMVLQVDPIFRAVSSILSKGKKKTKVLLFSTRGKKLTSSYAERLSKYERIVCICGRYEGVDERVAEYIADEEISIGEYVLSGGELAALVLAESTSRFLPGFLGKLESLESVNGSFSTYTRPEKFFPGRSKKSWDVPRVLVSGNHSAIKKWRARK
ncbi:MAG: tRNA (guanosine(37)-N1)-methyltransferase TrmD [Patescibacteria group bacterium]